MQQKPVSDDSDCTSSESDGDLSDEFVCHLTVDFIIVKLTNALLRDPAIPSISNITDALTMKITFADQLVEVVNHIEHSPSLESVHLMDSTVPDFEKLADPGVIRSPTEATIFVKFVLLPLTSITFSDHLFFFFFSPLFLKQPIAMLSKLP
jgi:hypothetical protein